MSPLDHLCRFCSLELDRSSSKNIFDSANSNLLKTALLCIPVPMSADDRYPKFSCGHCAFKLNIVTEFQDMGLSALSMFDEILSKEDNKSSEPEPAVEVKIEVLSDMELEEEEVSLSPVAEALPSHCINRLQYKECPVLFSPEKEGVRLVNTSPAKTSPVKQRTIQCEECKRCFTRQTHLARHMRVHSGEKPNQCSLCEKCFTRQTHLARHMRSHSGEKPNQCRVCQKCFARGEHLERHMLSHLRLLTGERPFQCKVCNSSYTRKDHLNRHQRKKGHGGMEWVEGTIHGASLNITDNNV